MSMDLGALSRMGAGAIWTPCEWTPRGPPPHRTRTASGGTHSGAHRAAHWPGCRAYWPNRGGGIARSDTEPAVDTHAGADPGPHGLAEEPVGPTAEECTPDPRPRRT